MIVCTLEPLRLEKTSLAPDQPARATHLTYRAGLLARDRTERHQMNITFLSRHVPGKARESRTSVQALAGYR